jgi:hypothetical protein
VASLNRAPGSERDFPTERPLVAARHNPILRGFYLRLRAAGKPAKLALTATTRKLLIVLNSALKTDLDYA